MTTNIDLKEYIVTLKNKDDLDNFYDDLETTGGSGVIPRRKVKCSNRRTISRNTHYLLTSEEAEKLKTDDRILDIVPKELVDNAIITPSYTQFSGSWNRSTFPIDNSHVNWGLLRCVNGSQTSNWGADGTPSQTAEIRITSSGKNVDFVLVDGHLDINHPEFAVNSDGTGGSRCIQYNWYQHRAELGLGSNGTYVYPTGSSLLNKNDNHGMHVGGTVAGNVQGWARDSKIYNISPYSNNGNGLSYIYIFDYIRAFHKNKSINSVTGRKNPTICNNSWLSKYEIPRSTITSINWRGTNYSAISPSNATLLSYGIRNFNSLSVFANFYINSFVADVQDAINDGVIFVGGAGNDRTKIDVPGGTDYNNTIVDNGGFLYFYHRGAYMTSASNAICVGSVSSVVSERKSEFSNTGPRISVYSPGEAIMSALHTSGGDAIQLVDDPRNSSYKLGKYQGTSMASPQVCGVIACLLEQKPRMKQSDVVDYINLNSKINQIPDTNGGYSDDASLQGSPNQYLFYKKERLESGYIGPRVTYKARRSVGQVYPRVNLVTYSIQ